MQFHEKIAASLDMMTEVLVKEQVLVQRDHFAAIKLEWVWRDHCQGRWKSF
jgi:hypothetical protein